MVKEDPETTALKKELTDLIAEVKVGSEFCCIALCLSIGNYCFVAMN